ncbi:MAG: division/cell wall cluster transcriptional repressor MraZ [Clostridiales bacterium]|nr:division/cell wall cluster transcriptional repressor MraZ [Clostridiales bacterium]
MFSGRSYHSIDAKNRLIIPSAHRLELGSKVYITKGYDSNLFILPYQTMMNLAQKIASMPETDPATRAYKRIIIGDSYEWEVDKQGRVLLQQYLMDFAKINKDIVILGSIDRLEVWSKEVFEATTPTDEDFESVLKELSSRGV